MRDKLYTDAMTMFNGKLRPFERPRDAVLACLAIGVLVAFSYAVGAGWWPPVGGVIVAVGLDFLRRRNLRTARCLSADDEHSR